METKYNNIAYTISTDNEKASDKSEFRILLNRLNDEINRLYDNSNIIIGKVSKFKELREVACDESGLKSGKAFSVLDEFNYHIERLNAINVTLDTIKMGLIELVG